MTRVYLNTLFVGTQEAYLHLENEQVRVMLGDQKILQVPLHHLGSIVLFGRVSASFPLLIKCAEDGRAFVLMTEFGRFRARVQGKTSGNVLLRQALFDLIASKDLSMELARCIVAGKLQNSRQTLLRAFRDSTESAKPRFSESARELEVLIASLPAASTLDELRGVEGMAAQAYFDVFDAMITSQRTDFKFEYRSRRPPRDRVNALLSFLYSLWTNDCVSALEGVGLDPQAGVLHALRPGRPSLALDLVEEFRSVILDRLCLTLINRKQIQAKHLVVRKGESVMLTDEGRKILLTAYQSKKQQEVKHQLFKEKVPIGLLPHIQSRILARFIRGEIPSYIPYLP
jgi:CRISPR-associated protein Cas1